MTLDRAAPVHVCGDAARAARSVAARVWIAGGTFPIGSNHFYPEERPVLRVTVDGFWMDEHPVAEAEFRRFVEVLAGYADELERANGRLYLTGISEEVHRQLARMRKLQLSGPVRVYEATSVRGESTRRAYACAEAWLVRQDSDGGAEGSSGG